MFRSSSSSSNEQLIAELKAERMLTSKRVEDTMRYIDRKHFVKSSSEAYVNAPAGIGHGQTISAPHIHSYMLELLKDKIVPGASVLDVGCGSGYLTAALAHMVGPSGRVTAIDRHAELVSFAEFNVSKFPELVNRITFTTGDGKQGYEKNAPYDAIHVGATAKRIPDSLIHQLKPDGLLCIPVEDSHGAGQSLLLVKKNADGSISEKKTLGVRFVPLV
ncbi:hypothetical protein P9112_005271 [Eukaryota sp. TZLM1-RC]